MDNTTAVVVINHMGTLHSDACHSVAIKIWEFCIENSICLTASHEMNDYESRNFCNIDMEWMLNPRYLSTALKMQAFQPKIDLFASRLNKQFAAYCSFRSDPAAAYIDAFSISWSALKFCCFPPFSCILRVLQKIIQDKAEGIVVVPNWPTQPWYPVLNALLTLQPVRCLPSKTILILPSYPNQHHPLHRRLEILICHLSGNNWRSKDCPNLP